MENYHKKDVGRALTTDEIRLQAHKWTLAGDVGLLAHLEQFSQNLLNQSQETKKNLDALLDSVEDTSTTINNVTNQFLALQNSQFVENRVCDDESPTDEFKPNVKVFREEQENFLLAEYKEAVEIGVKLLDSHFEEIHLPPNSDSDEEEDTSAENPGLVWKPKNPYAGRRFPLLIGSAEWWADDNVGLGEYEENINSDLVSPESESDIEAEDTAKKHIKISLSVNMESEKILKEKLNSQNDLDINDDDEEEEDEDEDNIFVPIGKGLFNIQSNLLKRKDEYEGINRQSILNIERSNIKSSNSISMNHENYEVCGVTDSSKRINNFSNDKNHENNEINEPCFSMSEQNKFQNAFTKELTAKLSSVANKNIDNSETKKSFEKRQNKDASALFDENDSSDNLFSAKNSVSDALFKKDFIFFDGDIYDPLFSNSENLFSESVKGPALKKTVKITSPKESIEYSNEDNIISKPFSKKIKFSDDDNIFGSNDDLLSGKSYGPLQNSRGPTVAQKEKREVKFSTPTEQRDNLEVPNADNIFEGVSGIKSDNSSTIENVSAISNEMDNSFNFARIVSNEASKDDGFIEPSDISNNKSGKFPSSESPGLFEPRLSSTRHLISDTSDYKTQRLSSNLESHGKSNSTESHLQSNSKNEIGRAEKTHFSREQSEVAKSKSLFVDDDEDDDLFQSSKSTKLIKEKSLFSNIKTENLFSNSTPNENKNQSLFDDKNENVSLFQKSSLALFDDEEEKSTVPNKLTEQDSVSMSSSRSSLFDDVNINKSNLATVFNKDKASKSSDNFFSVQDDNLFMKKVLSLEDSEKIFSDNLCNKSMKKESKHLSLFEDIGDVDDLFENVQFTKSAKDFEEDSDLFGKHSDVMEKPFKNVKNIEGNVIQANSENSKFADRVENTEKEDIFFDQEPQTLFGESLHSNFEKTDSKFIDKQNTFNDSFFKPKELSDSDCVLFGGTYDREEDLFKDDKSESKISIKEIKKTDTSAAKNQDRSITLFDDNSYYDDIFKNISPKDDIDKNELSRDLQSREKVEVTKNVKQFEDFQTNFLINTENSANEKENISKKYDELDKIKGFKENCTNTKEASFSRNKFTAKTCENNTPIADKHVRNIYNNKSFKESELKENVEHGIRSSSLDTLRTVGKINLQNKGGYTNSEADGFSISVVKPKIVGKLNIPTNLKINPMSLLPGTTMKKNIALQKEDERQEIAENQDNMSMENPPETSSNLLKCLSKDRVKIQSYRRPQTRRARHEALRSSGMDFQISSQETTNATSRSKSVDDFEKNLILPPKNKSSSDTNVNNSLIATNEKEIETIKSEAKDGISPKFHSIENSPDALFPSLLPSNPLSPSTDEEDYFNIPELDINFEREDQSIFNSSEKDFKSDDNLLFNDAPVLSPVNLSKGIVSVPVREKCEEVAKSNVLSKNTAKSSKIFKSLILIDEVNQEDDDDTLFRDSEAKLPNISLPKKVDVKTELKDIFDDLDDQDSFFFEDKPRKVFGNQETSKSLFIDNNDDYEDLFGKKESPSVSSNKITQDSTLKNKINANVFKKAKEPFIDPLGLMSSKD